MEYVVKQIALNDESSTSNVTILGEFNAGFDTQFDAEL